MSSKKGEGEKKNGKLSRKVKKEMKKYIEHLQNVYYKVTDLLSREII